MFRRLVAFCVAVLLPLTAAGTVSAWAAPARHAKQTVTLPAPVPCPRCWHPSLDTSWQWQLSGTLDLSLDVRMYDVDMFETSPATVQQIQDLGDAVVCYIDAGTWENFRPDAGRFPKSVLGKRNGWPGERWLDIRSKAIRPIMAARMDQCAQKGFNGVEFDNVDGYANKTGFPITSADQLKYDTWLANQAHLRQLSVALKNDVGQVKRLLPYFDFSLDEQCFQYKECSKLTPFITAGKPVFEVEYNLTADQFCSQANAMNFNSLVKQLDLGVYRESCR